MIFGVCERLAESVAWTPQVWRLIFIATLFVGGAGVGVYILLAIIFGLSN